MELLTTNKITEKQRKRIFVLSRQAGLSSGELHSYLPDWCGGYSLSSDNGISAVQADKVITVLNKIINKSSSKDKPTAKQIKAIKTLQYILKWGNVALERFMDRTVKKSSLNELSFREASDIISGLNRVKIGFLQKKSVKSKNQKSQFA